MTAFILQDAVAMVTGCSKPNGIGRSIVDALLGAGVSKVYATARHATQLDDLVAKYNGKVVAVTLDVTDLAAVAALSTLYPDVTILINNAGSFGGNSTLGSMQLALEEMQINYFAPLAMGMSFAPVFARLAAADSGNSTKLTKSSAMVNIDSITSFVNLPGGETYSASKAAARSLTEAQRRDMPNTLVVGVYPGFIDTDMTELVETDKPPPSVVANAIMDALEKGDEDVFPDRMAQEWHDGWKADAKAMEHNMTTLASA